MNKNLSFSSIKTAIFPLLVIFAVLIVASPALAMNGNNANNIDNSDSDKKKNTKNKDAYCSDCDYWFRDKWAYVNHVRTFKHPKKAPQKFFCDTCGNNYPTENKLQNHAATHASIFPCRYESCKATLFSEAERDEHEQKVHEIRL